MFANDPQLHIGTSSWSSKDWVGPFYPEGIRPERFIEHYASIYDTVEIDATFYRMPTVKNIDAWHRRTPSGFTFALKTPRIITHDKCLIDASDDMRLFIDTISKLDDRLGPVLLQFPYFNKRAFTGFNPFFERLDNFLTGLPSTIRFAVEIRNKAWVNRTLFDICRSHNVSLAWVEQAWMPKAHEWAQMEGALTTDFAYVRWLGDHKGIEKLTKKWGALVIDQADILNSWTGVLRGIREKNVKVFGFFNNHFAGFGPGSVEMFRTLYEETPPPK